MTPLIPDKYRVLSGSALKLLAVVTMVIDHTAYAFLYKDYTVLMRVGDETLYLYDALTYVGRIAFPIFAFLLVEGFLHTGDRRMYGLRLLSFAVVSELPWNLEHVAEPLYPQSQNVFFTLFLGYLGLCVLERLESGEGERRINALALLGLLAGSVLLHADYGCSGFGFILMLYLLRDRPLPQAVVGSCFLSSRWVAGLAFIPINLYNGKRGFIRGRFAQVFFYAFYPLHMLALYYIKLRTIGY